MGVKLNMKYDFKMGLLLYTAKTSAVIFAMVTFLKM